ncbi:response regulator, partial [Blautia wexlerae]|uniref:response regulator n=1 Tax=Blautia wexlerae TaxID=418240 RepID=UPI0021094394
PDKTGLEVLKEINKRTLKTKVFFLCGFQEFSYAKEAVTYGAVDYLLKRVSVEELENAIKRA